MTSNFPPPCVVIMGVAGCGKSTLGAGLAQQLGLAYVEGDDHHPADNLTKMKQGVPLTDADRAGWLTALSAQLRMHRACGVVLSCSALKKAYRDQLRAAAPGLRFIHLTLSIEEASARVSHRAPTHVFPASLVRSQFDTLESPEGEGGVLSLSALLPTATAVAHAAAWLQKDVNHV